MSVRTGARTGTVLLVLLAVGTWAAGSGSAAESVSAFEKLKALAGRWEGRHSDGSPARAVYQVLSGGSVVAEFLADETGADMITVYHLDQDDLRLTHYCSSKNQPRMKATSISADTSAIHFDFVDATNLAKPSDGHMWSLKVRLLEEDHIEQEWTWREGDQETREIIRLTRVR